MGQLKSVTVLFSSAGRRVELIRCFREDAARLGLSLRVLATDLRPRWSSACQEADEAFEVPRCTEAGFLPRMIELCRGQRVDLVVPTIDTELEVLAGGRPELESGGTRVAVSDPSVVAMARDKLATERWLREAGIPVPRTTSLRDWLASTESWPGPVILKPVGGSCSVGIHRVADRKEARALPLDPEKYMVQEWLRGDEYTVNVYFDGAGLLRAAVPHRRVEVRAGEVSKGVTERHARLCASARVLGDRLKGGRGALCFQAVVSLEGTIGVFEINARFGGGYPLAHAAGARFSQWMLEEVAGLPGTAHDQWVEGLAMLRYDAAVFVSPGSA